MFRSVSYITLLSALVLAGCGGATLRDPYPFYQDLDKAWVAAEKGYKVCDAHAREGKLEGDYGITHCKAMTLKKELQKAGYPYMDLAEKYLFTLRETAMQVDCGETEKEVADAQQKAAYTHWLKEEERRCQTDTFAKNQRTPSSFDMRGWVDKRQFECYGLHVREEAK